MLIRSLFRSVAAVGAALLTLVAAPATMAAGPAVRDPDALTRFVEQRAASTDFAKLELFGEQARNRADREGLNRLYHVTWTLLNQGDFEKAALWNNRLDAAARRLGDLRYQKIAHLNVLTIRYDTGDTSAAVEMRRMSDTDPDWFVGAHAVRLAALALMDEDEIGEGLRLLTEFEARIPADAPYAATARAGIWEVAGVGLMKLNDLGGAAAAFHRFEVEFSNPAYPRPDFDSIYNLTRMAVQLGDHAQARRLYEAHHRLSVRAGLESLLAYDANLCVMTAEGRQDWPGVLNCLKPYAADLGAADFLATHLLPARAIALARTGRVAEAQRDLSEIRRRVAAGEFREEGPSEIPHVEAELMFATGRAREAFDLLQDYRLAQDVYDTRRFSAGIAQVTGDMQEKLDERRLQLQTAGSNARLQKVVIDSQRWLVAVVALFLLTALGALVWLAWQAGRLREARARAETANRAKSEFLANMSHEIRTPLNGVVAMADALGRDALPPRQREMIEIIRSSGETLERLLSDILDSAKIESGQLSLESAPFALRQTISDIGALWRARAEDKGLLLHVDIDPALPGFVQGDIVRVRQVIGNLVSNAVKFTGAGEVRLAVTVEPDDRVLITVSDTGVGFDEAQMSRLFTRFQQADGSITRQFGGTGLGLAISRDLVERMGGEMGCASRPGEGARFWVRLPLPPVEIVPDIPDATSAEASTSEPQGELRILLADDHPANRKVVEVLLSVAEVELVSVEDGQQAVDAYRKERFDLVLMDMQMPVLDGLSATRAIRALEQDLGLPRTPLLMLTANAMAEHVAAGAEAGADGHLSKPVTSDRLFAAIETALSGRVDPTEPGSDTQAA
ncbi:ATP-binding protein [Brevundimonas sp. VNH65]|uniref:hybrid sensor histidine kinase/response regulator n=1 Tax=Brevundimonas sp. VNH65 TaxID=3400917 RepID=UPI003C0CF83D